MPRKMKKDTDFINYTDMTGKRSQNIFMVKARLTTVDHPVVTTILTRSQTFSFVKCIAFRFTKVTIPVFRP